MDTHSAYSQFRGSIKALTIALDERDAYTRFHCDRVVVLAKELGEACGIVNGELDLLHLGALFHDVGKIGIPDKVLLKPSGLDSAEWVVMKAHSEKGERIIRSAALDVADALAPIIRHHHEAFDGSGYPDGLAGEEIPLLSRILLVADSYDAMRTARPYRLARSHEQVMAVLESENGSRLDPDVFFEFSRLIDHSVAAVN
jgi:HD-GYP domain-containing protein (c-di-GMP phosphodiesterase class II)